MAIGPQQYLETSSKPKIAELEERLDEEILKYADREMYPWVSILIDPEYTEYVRNIVAKKYINIGWHTVCHQTSTENGENGGLTEFVFLTVQTLDKFEKAFLDYKDRYWVLNNDGIINRPKCVRDEEKEDNKRG